MAKRSTPPTAQPKQVGVAETTAPNGYEGQMGQTEVTAILKIHRANAAEARLAFLQSHPDYLPCSVAGCEGLVGPNYQRVTVQGRKYGFCPRRKVHARLMPFVFSAR
jgi:hypothetical protein